MQGGHIRGDIRPCLTYTAPGTNGAGKLMTNLSSSLNAGAAREIGMRQANTASVLDRGYPRKRSCKSVAETSVLPPAFREHFTGTGRRGRAGEEISGQCVTRKVTVRPCRVQARNPGATPGVPTPCPIDEEAFGNPAAVEQDDDEKAYRKWIKDYGFDDCINNHKAFMEALALNHAREKGRP